MRMTPAQRAQKVLEIRRKYDAYMAAKKDIRDAVRARVEKEAAREIDDLTMEFSRELHRYASEGVPKVVLREGVKAYSNGQAFRKLWDPADDGTSVVSTQKTREPLYEVRDDGVYIIRGMAGSGAVPVYVGPQGLLDFPSVLWREEYVGVLEEMFPGKTAREIEAWIEGELVYAGETLEDFKATVKEQDAWN